MTTYRSETAQLHVSRRGCDPLQSPPQEGAMLDILVSDAVTRYWILERPAGMNGAGELDRYVAERFAEVFGDDPEAWVLSVNPLPQAERWLACAVPAIFAVDLPRLAEAKGWCLRSVQPRFVREYQRHCRDLGPDSAFCVASDETTTIGLITNGSWRGIHVHPPLGNGGDSFGALLRRDCRQAGILSDRLEAHVVGPLREIAR
jgi:hypothetical protein